MIHGVPRTIHRILLWGKDLPPRVRPYYDELHSLNPGWEVRLWRHDDAIELIKEQGLRKTFARLQLKIQQVDFLRYLILLQHGGCYADFDIVVTTPLDEVVTKYGPFEFLAPVEFCWSDGHDDPDCGGVTNLTRERPGLGPNDNQPIRGADNPEEAVRIANYLLLSRPGSTMMKLLVERCIARASFPVRSDYDVFWTTGPALVSQVYHELKHDDSLRGAGKAIPLSEARSFVLHYSRRDWKSQLRGFNALRLAVTGAFRDRAIRLSSFLRKRKV